MYQVKSKSTFGLVTLAEAQMDRVTRELSRARRQCRGRFYRLTDCHPLEEDGGMACLSSSRKHLAGVPGLTPRVEGDEVFFTPGLLRIIMIKVIN